MELIVKNGRVVTDDNRQYKELNKTEKKIFGIIVKVKQIIEKYNL